MELWGDVAVNLICVGLLAALGLRKLILMESYHAERVVLLTGLLWALAVYLFVIAYVPPPPSCEPGAEVLCPPSCVLR